MTRSGRHETGLSCASRFRRQPRNSGTSNTGFEVVAIYPRLPGIERDARYDGFRRDWLNIFQVNPRVQMLANNSASDPCAFTLFEYSSMARHTPPLAEGLTCLDLIRMTLDRYLAGAKGYGQVGYAAMADAVDFARLAAVAC